MPIGDFFSDYFRDHQAAPASTMLTSMVERAAALSAPAASAPAPHPGRALGRVLVTKPAPLASARVPIGIRSPALTTTNTIPTVPPSLASSPNDGGVGGGLPIAYTQGQADAAASKVPVTLIAAGVGAVAVGLFVFSQLRKKRR